MSCLSPCCEKRIIENDFGSSYKSHLYKGEFYACGVWAAWEDEELQNSNMVQISPSYKLLTDGLTLILHILVQSQCFLLPFLLFRCSSVR